VFDIAKSKFLVTVGWKLLAFGLHVYDGDCWNSCGFREIALPTESPGHLSN